MCVAIVLGTINLTRVMSTLILNLNTRVIERLIIEIWSQLTLFNIDNPKILLDKTQMPMWNNNVSRSTSCGVYD